MSYPDIGKLHFSSDFGIFQGPSSSPVHRSSSSSGGSHSSHAGHSRHGSGGNSNNPSGAPGKKQPVLKGVDSKLANLILDEIVEGSCPVQWDDIAGQKVCTQVYFHSAVEKIFQ